MNDPYSILGVPRTATDDEVKAAYRNLARKYHPDNYTDDNPLKDLAKEKMQDINNAYDEIQRSRASGGTGSSYESTGGNSAGGFYNEVRTKIQKKHFREAESMLAGVNEYDRVAEWHFLMSICLVQRGRPNDAMRELEIACNMDPANMEYQKAKEMFNNRNNASYGSAYYGYDSYGYRRTDADRACDCCSNLICLDCLCACMGGDLIRCI